jgi:hypothetical protein
MHRPLLAAAFLSLVPVSASIGLAASPAAAQQAATGGMTAEAINARIDEVFNELEKINERMSKDPKTAAGIEKASQEVALKALKGIDLATLDASAFAAAGRLWDLAGPEQKKAYETALANRAKQPTALGFMAAVQMTNDAIRRGTAAPDAVASRAAAHAACSRCSPTWMPPRSSRSRAASLRSRRCTRPTRRPRSSRPPSTGCDS